MLKTTPPTAESTPDVALTQVKHRRRPLLWVLAALLIALMGFVGTVALSKFLLRGDIIE